MQGSFVHAFWKKTPLHLGRGGGGEEKGDKKGGLTCPGYLCFSSLLLPISSNCVGKGCLCHGKIWGHHSGTPSKSLSGAGAPFAPLLVAVLWVPVK